MERAREEHGSYFLAAPSVSPMLLCCSLQTFPWWSFRWVFAPPLLLARVREADDAVGPDCWCGSRGLELWGWRATAWGTGEDRWQMGEREQWVLEPLPLFGLSHRTLRLLLGPSLKSYFFSFHHSYPLCCPLNFSLIWLPPYNPQFNHSPLLFLLSSALSVIVVTSVNHSRRSHLPVSHILSFLSQSSSFILTHERSL